MFASPLPAAQLTCPIKLAEVPSVAATTEGSNACVGTCNLLMATAPHRDVGGALRGVVGLFLFLFF